MLFLQRQIALGQPLLIRGEVALQLADSALDVLQRLSQSPEQALFGIPGSEKPLHGLAIKDLASIFGERPTSYKSGDTAFIPVDGPIGYKTSPLDKAVGACDVEQLSNDLAKYEADKDVKRIVFDFNTPGGTVRGIPELANAIANCKKSTIGFTDTHCESAGMWLGSQCREFVATPSASVGSIGVFSVFPDYSKKAEMEGVRMRVFKAGKHKAAGVIGTSLTPEQEEGIQRENEELWAMFKNDVRSKRSTVKDEDMEGQSFSARKAASRGLITGLATSRAAFLARFRQGT